MKQNASGTDVKNFHRNPLAVVEAFLPLEKGATKLDQEIWTIFLKQAKLAFEAMRKKKHEINESNIQHLMLDVTVHNRKFEAMGRAIVGVKFTNDTTKRLSDRKAYEFKIGYELGGSLEDFSEAGSESQGKEVTNSGDL